MRILRNKLKHRKNWQATSVTILRRFSPLPYPGLSLMGKVYSILRYVSPNFDTLKTSVQQLTKILPQDLKAGCYQRRQKAASYFMHTGIILDRNFASIYCSKIKKNASFPCKYSSITSRFWSTAMFRTIWLGCF